MRVSCRADSPHYKFGAQVLLWSKPLAFAVEADDQEGWVDVRDLDAAENGEHKVKRLTGRVEIVLP